jgi:uncharacterized lipoprotein YajG
MIKKYIFPLAALALLAGCDAVPDFAREALVDALQTEVQQIASDAIDDVAQDVFDDVLSGLPIQLPADTADETTAE